MDVARLKFLICLLLGFAVACDNGALRPQNVPLNCQQINEDSVKLPIDLSMSRVAENLKAVRVGRDIVRRCGERFLLLGGFEPLTFESAFISSRDHNYKIIYSLQFTADLMRVFSVDESGAVTEVSIWRYDPKFLRANR